MNFNKERFANFAKYDLTINRTFFRNMALVTLAGAIGIAMLGFMLRYNIYRDVATNATEWGGEMPTPDDFTHYAWNYLTSLYEFGFITLMMAIFAGCWAHNLRNKQGRITELTLPATNLEKFTWHALLMLVGGFALSLIGLLTADGFNALLTLLVYGADEGVGSLTLSLVNFITFNMPHNEIFTMPNVSVNGEVSAVDVPIVNLRHATTFLITTTFLCETIIFYFGNALKYKYNIILTYIALQVIGTIGTIIFFICTAFTTANAIDAAVEADWESEDVANFFAGSFVVIGILSLILSAVLMWKSYHLYAKAQITSSLNK